MIWLFLLTQWIGSPSGRTQTVLSGNWQSCRDADGSYSERIYDGPGYELHMGPRDEFALFAGNHDEHLDHASRTNLLGTAYHVGDMQTWRGKRNWTLPTLKLWLHVTQAGGSRGDCESFWVLLERWE